MKFIRQIESTMAENTLPLLLKLKSNILLLSLVREHKNKVHLFNPVMVIEFMDQKGVSHINLKPYVNIKLVDCFNTVIKKSDVESVFMPKAGITKYYFEYLSKLSATVNAPDPRKSKGKSETTKEESSGNNVISFANFKKEHQKVSQSETANTEPPDSPDVA